MSANRWSLSTQLIQERQAARMKGLFPPTPIYRNTCCNGAATARFLTEPCRCPFSSFVQNASELPYTSTRIVCTMLLSCAAAYYDPVCCRHELRVPGSLA